MFSITWLNSRRKPLRSRKRRQKSMTGAVAVRKLGFFDLPYVLREQIYREALRSDHGRIWLASSLSASPHGSYQNASFLLASSDMYLEAIPFVIQSNSVLFSPTKNWQLPARPQDLDILLNARELELQPHDMRQLKSMATILTQRKRRLKRLVISFERVSECYCTICRSDWKRMTKLRGVEYRNMSMVFNLIMAPWLDVLEVRCDDHEMIWKHRSSGHGSSEEEAARWLIDLGEQYRPQAQWCDGCFRTVLGHLQAIVREEVERLQAAVEEAVGSS